MKRDRPDRPLLRALARTIFLLGDGFRPVVQRPIVSQFIGPGIFEHALDAGCGRGLYTRVLAKRSKCVAAIDLSHEQVTITRGRDHSHRVRYCRGSVAALPFADGTFDLAIHCEVLEHIPDDSQALRELHRTLRPGGRLIISVPVPPAPVEDGQHVREGYTLPEISRRLTATGFEILRHQFCMFELTKSVMRLNHWVRQRTRIPMPSVVLFPLLVERFIGDSLHLGSPYDVVIEARKNATAI